MLFNPESERSGFSNVNLNFHLIFIGGKDVTQEPDISSPAWFQLDVTN